MICDRGVRGVYRGPHDHLRRNSDGLFHSQKHLLTVDRAQCSLDGMSGKGAGADWEAAGEGWRRCVARGRISGMSPKFAVIYAVWIIALLVFGALPAWGSFEWVGMPEGVFASIGTEGELSGGSSGVAANFGCAYLERTAGHKLDPGECVTDDPFEGNVYVADRSHYRISVFGSHGNFSEAWGWDVAGNEIAFQHCGPKVVAHPHCATEGLSGEGQGQFAPEGIAVDQANGRVFVLNGHTSGVVQVMSGEGEYVSSFGSQGGEGEPVTDHPQLIRSVSPGGIAFDQVSGDVYVVDTDRVAPEEGRVMVFKPGGVPGSYEYAGDFAVGDFPREVAVDGSGDVFVTGGQENRVYEFGPGGIGAPLWVHEDGHAVAGLTADLFGEDVFYYTDTNRKFHELRSGEELSTKGKATGVEWPGVEIEEEVNGALEKRQEHTTYGLAFNPGLVWTECLRQSGGPFEHFEDSACTKEKASGEYELVKRPPGVLYAIDSNLIAGLVFAEPPLFPPSVEGVGVSVGGIGSGSAVLEATVHPHGFDTKYRFEYGTEDCIENPCAQSVPAPA